MNDGRNRLGEMKLRKDESVIALSGKRRKTIVGTPFQRHCTTRARFCGSATRLVMPPRSIGRLRRKCLRSRRSFTIAVFVTKDRVNIQDRVIAAFKESDTPCLAVTTQVCEMSLDISAQLMVTALPPFPSLVQRLGRVNRRGEVEEGRTVFCVPVQLQRW